MTTATCWVDRATYGFWEDRLAPAMSQPGVWTVVYRTWKANTAYGSVRDLRNGRQVAPPGRWEFQTRRQGLCGQWAVWARYLGPDE